MHSRTRLRSLAMVSLLYLLGGSAAGSGQDPDTVLPSRGPAADRILGQLLARDGGVGVMAAVIVDGKLAWSGAAGWADLEAGISLRPDHLLRIGSVSKPLTAGLVLELCESGKLDLDQSIRTYLPELGEQFGPVTLRQLGAHTGGVRHYDFSRYLEANNVMYRPTLADGLADIATGPLIAPPNTGFHYSSYGFNLLGAAVERVTGQTYTEVFESAVAQPLGLRATRTDHPLRITPDRARFYTVCAANPVMTWMADGEVINTIFRDNSDLYPSGGMLSNAEDLAKFACAVFESDFLLPESRGIIEQPARLGDGTRVRWNEGQGEGCYSFGWGVFGADDAQPEYLGHGGETNGAYALIRYFPKQRIAVAGVTNYNRVSGGDNFFTTIGQELPKLFMPARD